MEFGLNDGKCPDNRTAVRSVSEDDSNNLRGFCTHPHTETDRQTAREVQRHTKQVNLICKTNTAGGRLTIKKPIVTRLSRGASWKVLAVAAAEWRGICGCINQRPPR